MKKLFSFLIILTLLVNVLVIVPTVNAEEVQPYDYSSFVGTWYDADNNMTLHVKEVIRNEITFDISDLALAKHGLPIVNNQIIWNQISPWATSKNILTFYDDSIYYASISGSEKSEYWFISDTIKPRKFETGNYSVILNNEKLEFDQQPIMCGNRILVPLRKIFEQLGATFDYYKEIDRTPGHISSELIFIKAKIEHLELRLNFTWQGYWEYMIYSGGNLIKREYLVGESGYISPIIINGRTLVPVRLVSEALGADVDWNDETQTVIINTNSTGNTTHNINLVGQTWENDAVDTDVYGDHYTLTFEENGVIDKTSYRQIRKGTYSISGNTITIHLTILGDNPIDETMVFEYNQNNQTMYCVTDGSTLTKSENSLY